ncbi:hypothetical protein FRB94_006559 [Tulasnella sp. JGI-2019a]|nr:hypothetical protein FRB93_012100 [Tulasnella sp. JGI-2019a]KAG9012191.1 hypothetical protein FRB94_006559 [Tulasnella sp. JGI-2019a]
MHSSSSAIDELTKALDLNAKAGVKRRVGKSTIGMSPSASSSSSHLSSPKYSPSSTPPSSEPRTPAPEDPKPLEEGYIDIPAPDHTDLLTDYNTIQNTDIPAPLWARLDNEYCEWKGIEASPERPKLALEGSANSVGGDGILCTSDGRPLKRVPAIRAIKEWEESDEDEDDDGSKQIFIPSPPQPLKALKEAAAKRRETNPSSLTVAVKEAEARIEAARKARSEQLEKIEKWDKAIKMLNKQKDLVVVERMKALEANKEAEPMMIEGTTASTTHPVEDEEGRFEEL